MSDVEKYKRFAEQCLDLAEDAEIGGPCRKVLLEMAMTWATLAEDASAADLASADKLPLH